jgi:glycosyltransferase involved in cell wall biosynthesis
MATSNQTVQIPGIDALIREGTDPGALQAARQPALVSVIIPCFGQYEHTRLCVPSLLRTTRKPIELIFVDGGSVDGTVEYLCGLQAGASVPVEVVTCNSDAGSGAAFNLGLSRATGSFVVLLANDVILTPGWLEQLTSLANVDPQIGAVGPMFNYGTPPQLAPDVPYRLKLRAGSCNVPEESLERFAREWRDAHRGEWFLTDRLDTSCLLFKREVLRAIGPIDKLATGGDWGARPRGNRGNPITMAIRQTGAKMACCRDLFIHHFGTHQAALLSAGSKEPEFSGE